MLATDPRMSTHADGTSQTMRALLRLRELLLSGEFAPGARMSELPLVDRLGVSRTPLRLALAALEHEGFLRVLPGGGYVVREFTRADIDDSIELRGVLEGTAARFAAERGVSRRELKAMADIVEQTDEVVHEADYASFEMYVDLNERFHALIYEAARSPLLTRALEQIIALPLEGGVWQPSPAKIGTAEEITQASGLREMWTSSSWGLPWMIRLAPARPWLRVP